MGKNLRSMFVPKAMQATYDAVTALTDKRDRPLSETAEVVMP